VAEDIILDTQSSVDFLLNFHQILIYLHTSKQNNNAGIKDRQRSSRPGQYILSKEPRSVPLDLKIKHKIITSGLLT